MMDPDVQKVHMQNLEQYVLDENKIVTSKWLSNNLSLHINVAKKLMEDFLDNQRSKRKDADLVITYFVSGILKEQKGLTSTVVNDSDLKDLKASLESVLSEHIYSIQRTETKTDSNALYLAGQCDDFCLGGIKNDSICKRTRDELSSLRLGAYPASAAPVGKTVQKNNPQAKESVVKKELVKEVTHNGTNGKESNNKVTAPKNGDIKKKETTVNVGKGKNSIAGFFSKQSSSPKIVKAIPKTEPGLSKGKNEESKNKKDGLNTISFPKVEKTVSNGDGKVTSPDKDKQKKPEEVKLETKTSTSSKNKKQNDKKKSSKSPKEAPKKRKRIQCFDSDSEKESGSDDDIFKSSSPEPVNITPLSDDEDMIPATPKVSKPTANKLSLNSRKRKKLIDKMYMKDDGYILTVKEEVYESCSDEDVTEETKKVTTPVKSAPLKVENNENKKPNNGVESKSKAKKKTSPQGQSKQSNLMSFFTKK